MSELTEEANNGTAATSGSLDDLIQRGARQIIQQAVEAELTTLLEQYQNAKTAGDKRAVIRNGYLPEHEVVAAIWNLRIPELTYCWSWLVSLREIRKYEVDVLIDTSQWLRISAILADFTGGAKFTIDFRTRRQFRHYVYDISIEHCDGLHELGNFRKQVQKTITENYCTLQELSRRNIRFGGALSTKSLGALRCPSEKVECFQSSGSNISEMQST